MSEMRILHIHDLGAYLNLKDVRAIRKWCRDNQVNVYMPGTKSEYVYENDFEFAFNKEKINEIKSLYGEGWYEHYERYKAGDIRITEELIKREKQKVSVIKINKRATNETENRILNKAGIA